MHHCVQQKFFLMVFPLSIRASEHASPEVLVHAGLYAQPIGELTQFMHGRAIDIGTSDASASWVDSACAREIFSIHNAPKQES